MNLSKHCHSWYIVDNNRVRRRKKYLETFQYEISYIHVMYYFFYIVYTLIYWFLILSHSSSLFLFFFIILYCRENNSSVILYWKPWKIYHTKFILLWSLILFLSSLFFTFYIDNHKSIMSVSTHTGNQLEKSNWTIQDLTAALDTELWEQEPSWNITDLTVATDRKTIRNLRSQDNKMRENIS